MSESYVCAGQNENTPISHADQIPMGEIKSAAPVGASLPKALRPVACGSGSMVWYGKTLAAAHAAECKVSGQCSFPEEPVAFPP